MAIVRNRVLSDSASTASFEVVNDAGGETATVVNVATLSGAGDDDNQSVIVRKVIATVVSNAVADPSHVTLRWGDGTEFLYLPVGVTELDIGFEHHTAGGGDADIEVVATANTLFSLRLVVNKMTGFPLSMGHASHRP